MEHRGVFETISNRTSVRSYSGDPLTHDELRAVAQLLDGTPRGPFGGQPRFILKETEEKQNDGKIGTYGIISKAQAYILGAISAGPFACVDYGYCFEGLVLSVTAMGFGTCWLAGTFHRSSILRDLELTDKEIIPAISPLGRPRDSRTTIDRGMRLLARSDKRKPWSQLFFSEQGQGLEPGKDPWSRVLEGVRLGPSASNKQPWRIQKTGTSDEPVLHLFLDEDRVYTNAIPNIKLQDLDGGIAMYHIQALTRELDLPGAWKRIDPAPTLKNFRYLISWDSRLVLTSGNPTRDPQRSRTEAEPR